MKMQQGHAAYPCLMDMQNIHAAGHAVWTYSMKMQQGHASCPYLMDMLKYMQQDMQYGHAE
jgi:hypothetical protein